MGLKPLIHGFEMVSDVNQVATFSWRFLSIVPSPCMTWRGFIMENCPVERSFTHEISAVAKIAGPNKISHFQV
jgi:hypothetical protein